MVMQGLRLGAAMVGRDDRMPGRQGGGVDGGAEKSGRANQKNPGQGRPPLSGRGLRALAGIIARYVANVASSSVIPPAVSLQPLTDRQGTNGNTGRCAGTCLLELHMNGIIYLVGLVVVVMAILSLLGMR